MSSSSAVPPRKHSILSLLNSPLPDDHAQNRLRTAHVDAQPAHNDSSYRLHVADWTESHEGSVWPANGVAVSPDPYRSSPLVIRSESQAPPAHGNTTLRYNPSSTIPQHWADDVRRSPPISRKRGVSDVETPAKRPVSKRRGNIRDKKTDAEERIKTRNLATRTTTLNNGAPGTMYIITPNPNRGSRNEAPCRVTPVAFASNTTRRVELQMLRCMSTDYKKLEETFPHCISCTSRLAQDTCRFQHVRTFLLDNENKINGFYFADHEGDDPPTPLPPAGDVTLDRCLAQQTKKVAARALASGIRDELESMRRSGVVYMPMGGKATCDRCRGSIFLSSRMCILCGRALCTECFAQVELLTVLPPGGSQRELDGRWEAFSVRNPKFLDCLKASIRHSATDFVLVSKINRATVATALSDMEHLLRYEPSETAAPRASDAVISDHTSTSGSSKANCISNGSNFDLPTRTIQQFKESDLTEVIFRTLWAQGNPLLVTELVRKLKMNWSPEYFAQKFDSEHCNTIECQTEVNRWITVNEFFANFGRYDGREQCWKLQNFPPPSVKLTLSDFRSALPELYADLAQALPLPNYVCAEGVQNIASHFLFNSDEPDLGPTMDVAYANRTVAHSKGSVRLHMDRADTLNIIVFAAPDPDGREGRAAWDLFRAQDSDKVQQFLLTKLRTHRPPNPMHTNQAYLDDAARHDLWQQYGVKSYRVYQKAGDVVFIPAGCAYQVCNLSDCISVTTGFVPAEGIKRCEELAREVTLFNRTNNWKNPVLPLRDIMWAAWLACCRQEKLLASN